MPSLSDIQAYQASVDDVSALALAELLRFWRGVDGEDAIPAAVAVREFLPDLVDGYAPLSSEIAASFYDEARSAAGVRGSFLADLAPGRSMDALQRMISWAVAPLFRSDPKTQVAAPDTGLALSRLSGGTQLEIAESARDTIQHNGENDPAIARFARHASANACAFCALMATRGAVYRTAAAAGNGNKYHAHCHCVAYPVFEGEVDESPAYVTDWERAYRAARKAAKRAGVMPDLQGVLPYMRQSLGAA